VPLREIARQISDAGHPIHRDAVHRHLREHVAQVDVCDPGDLADKVALLVDGAADVLEKWPSRALDIAKRWLDDGAEAEAFRLVQRAVPTLMQHRLNRERS